MRENLNPRPGFHRASHLGAQIPAENGEGVSQDRRLGARRARPESLNPHAILTYGRGRVCAHAQVCIWCVCECVHTHVCVHVVCS